MNGPLTEFLLGVAVTCSAAIGLFFWRFWAKTRDRLFLALAAAFLLFGLNWLIQAIWWSNEGAPVVYAFRLVGFALIIAGIVSKNRRERGAAR